MKTCTKCCEAKTLSEFHSDGRSKDGLRSDCKLCRNARQAEYVRANRDKARAYRAAYYRANRDAILAREAAYQRANRDTIRARKAAHHRANRDKNCVRNADYRQANPHSSWESTYRKRCSRFGLIPVIVSFTRDDVVRQYRDACFYCDTGPFEELDHHLAVAAGGHHTLANARPSCRTCNRRKRQTTDRQAINAFRQPTRKAEAS